MFLVRGDKPRPNNIVVVGIDENSFDELNLQWPWPRGLHGKLIDTLYASGAKAVAFDLLFAEPSTEIEDQKLADAIARHGSVILGREVKTEHNQQLDLNTKFKLLKIVDPVPIIDRLPIGSKSATVGRVNPDIDSDGFIRRIDVERDQDDKEMISFPEAAAQQFALATGKTLPAGAIGGERWINFIGRAGSIQLVSYNMVVDPEHALPKDFFKDKLVFVGFADYSSGAPQEGLIDHFSTPLSHWGGKKMAGVEMHAQVAANVLSGERITWFNSDKLYLISTAVGLSLGILILSVSPIIALAIFTPIFAAGWLLSYFLFTKFLIFLSPAILLTPLSFIMLLSPIFQYVFVARQRSYVKKAFSTYLSPRLVEQLLEHPEQLDLAGEEREGTLLFLDLEGFTAFSEKLSPKELIQLINRTLGAFAEIVLKWDGMIDKYIGDALMAVWSVPLHDPEHALKAVLAAREILQKAKQLAEDELERTGITLGVRIGINSGTFVAGNVGGGQQFNYTVLGNEVNLASRLEGINKIFGSRVIISDRSVSRLGEGSEEKGILLRELDSIRVKGQKASVTVYELFSLTEGKEVSQRQVLSLYSQGLGAYKARKWETAHEMFKNANGLNPSDIASQLMLERCKKFMLEPPSESWDGITTMTEK